MFVGEVSDESECDWKDSSGNTGYCVPWTYGLYAWNLCSTANPLNTPRSQGTFTLYVGDINNGNGARANAAFSSRHSNGANFLFGDGHVTFLPTPSTRAFTWPFRHAMDKVTLRRRTKEKAQSQFPLTTDLTEGVTRGTFHSLPENQNVPFKQPQKKARIAKIRIEMKMNTTWSFATSCGRRPSLAVGAFGHRDVARIEEFFVVPQCSVIAVALVASGPLQ